MEMVMKTAAMSLIMGICCYIFFGTFLQKRRWNHVWIVYMILPAFTVGFLVIAWTPIPMYPLQPVRLILMLAVIVQIFFQVKLLQNLALSTLLASAYWMIVIVTDSVIYVLPGLWYQQLALVEEDIATALYLCLILLFCHGWKRYAREIPNTGWLRFGLIPLLSLVVMVSFSMLIGKGSLVNKNTLLTASLGLGTMNLCLVIFMGTILNREVRLQRLHLTQERTQRQMELYRSMNKNYEQQRRYLHDYKNQLTCIQGLLTEGKQQEASEYIAQLTGNLKKYVDTVDTRHAVVNVVLNQKYREACEKGITMVLAVNDLSSLTVREEDLVILLVNLLDNAIEACEKLNGHPVIQFKMMLEERELILSVRNPVKEPVFIQGKRAATTKRQKSQHGIGLLNVDEAVKRNGGTSVLQCRDGWFYFSAVIPKRY
ncbi:MAG: GHKL domain-containing protein [Lachnospiraceae bacterium]|nr:GHKL domain-containing protein [Lachnospiraceae bacterium]